MISITFYLLFGLIISVESSSLILIGFNLLQNYLQRPYGYDDIAIILFLLCIFHFLFLFATLKFLVNPIKGWVGCNFFDIRTSYLILVIWISAIGGLSILIADRFGALLPFVDVLPTSNNFKASLAALSCSTAGSMLLFMGRVFSREFR